MFINPTTFLLDFGLATNAGISSLPRRGAGGTPGYMAPELQSKVDFYDGRKADAWSL